MKNLFTLLVFALLVNTKVFSQTFQTHIEDTANYYYQVASDIYEENNKYSFFLHRFPLDSMDYGNLNYFEIDSSGNIVTDTILFTDTKFQGTHVLKNSNNNYYMLTYHIDKTDSLNGRIFQFDSSFNILNIRNLSYTGDSTFYVTKIEEVENNNIVFIMTQFDQPGNWPPRSIMYKTNENLDSLNFKKHTFLTPQLTYDIINMRYVTTPIRATDTLLIYLSYELIMDSAQHDPYSPPQALSHAQNSVILLNNHKKIYSCTALGTDYYMGLFLFAENMQILNYKMIDFGNSYPGEFKNLTFAKNRKYIYNIGSTNYWAYPEDSNSLILARLDTNLNIDYIKYYYNERSLTPLFLTSTSDGGCIVLGRYAYILTNQSAKCTFVAKFDSLGTLAWTKGIELEEKIAMVYPNPAQNTLNIRNGLIKQKANFALFDLQGRQVFSKELKPQENNFDVSALSKGVYIYKISDKEKIWQTGKIVKE